MISNLQRLTTTFTLNDGDWIVSKDMTTEKEVKLLQLGSIGFGKYIDKGFKYISEKTFNSLNCTEIYEGYLLINRLIAEKMFVTILPKIEGKVITAVDICWIAPNKAFNQKFVMYQLMSSRVQNLSILFGAGSTRLRISKGNLIKFALLIPPRQEQEKIVDAIEYHFELLDSLFQL